MALHREGRAEVNVYRATLTLDVPYLAVIEMVEPSNVYRASLTLDVPYIVELEAD